MRRAATDETKANPFAVPAPALSVSEVYADDVGPIPFAVTGLRLQTLTEEVFGGIDTTGGSSGHETAAPRLAVRQAAPATDWPRGVLPSRVCGLADAGRCPSCRLADAHKARNGPH